MKIKTTNTILYCENWEATVSFYKSALQLPVVASNNWGDTLKLEPIHPVTVYLEGVQFALLLIKQVFTNEDGSTGTQYLVTSDTTLNGNGIATIYQKRWNVEPYHKSLKQDASLEKSPTQTVTTQTNHLFAALCSYIKLELLKGDTQLNHFALKAKLYLNAVQSAYATLRELNPARLAA